MAFQILVQMSDHLLPLRNIYLANEVQLRYFWRTTFADAHLTSKNHSADPNESPPLPKQLGRICGCQRPPPHPPKCCKPSQTWVKRRMSPQASPFPVWLCGISARSRVEREHSRSVSRRCVNSDVAPEQAWPLESMNISYFYHIRLDQNQQQPVCFGCFSLGVTVLRLNTKPCPHSH